MGISVSSLHQTTLMASRQLAAFCLVIVSVLAAWDTQAAESKPKSHWQIPATDEGLPGSGPIRRYDWFKNLWAERRAAWGDSVQKDQHAVVMLGDSITQGWGDGLATAIPGLKVANRGISGDTTRGVLIRLKEDVISLNPSCVILLIGTNDLEEQADPETIAGNLALILGALKEHNASMPILLCQVFPSSSSQKRPSDKIKRINQLYAKLIRGNSQVSMVETWPLFADAKGDAKPDEFPDLLHPNAVGYAKWAGALRPFLATLGFTDTQPDRFVPEAGFVSLFNGHDLTGWGYQPTSKADMESAKRWQASDPNAAAWPFVTNAVRFDGLARSPDGRFMAKNGRLIVTVPAAGRTIQQIHTTESFSGDFVLRLEFRAAPNADSGIFVRGPQLQCRDYPQAGPYKQLKNYRQGGWNEIEIVVKDNVARSTCNGEVLEAAMKLPASGPIGLEGDVGQMEYRRLRIQKQ